MKKSTLFALVILAASSTVIGRVLFGTPVSLHNGWDYGFLAASFIFSISLAYIVIACAKYRLKISPSITSFAAWFGIAVSSIVFVGSIVMIFLPEKWKLFSDHVRNIITLWSLFILLLSSWHVTREVEE